jgi:hypothetical protein
LKGAADVAARPVCEAHNAIAESIDYHHLLVLAFHSTPVATAALFHPCQLFFLLR